MRNQRRGARPERLIVVVLAILSSAAALPACGPPAATAPAARASGPATGSSDEHPRCEPLSGALEGGPAWHPQPLALDREEARFLRLINAYRASRGLGALRPSASLTAAAKWMSRDMARGDSLLAGHSDSLGRDPFQRMAAFGYSHPALRGENLAAGSADAASTFEQWRSSAGHDENMLEPGYRVIGIGRAFSARSAYQWYWTTAFGSHVDRLLTASGDGPAADPAPEPSPAASPAPAPGPDAPISLAARAIAPTRAELTWQTPLPGVRAFHVYRLSRGRAFARIGLASAEKRRFVDTALQPGRTYSYRVRALLRGAGGRAVSRWSPTVVLRVPERRPAP